MEIHQVPPFLNKQCSAFFYPGHPTQVFVKKVSERLHTFNTLVDRAWAFINNQSAQSGVGILKLYKPVILEAVNKGNSAWNNWGRAFARAKGVVDGEFRGGRTVTRGEALFHTLFVDGEVRQMVDWLGQFVDIYGPVMTAAEIELEEVEWAKLNKR